jgi:hypothetical protein
MAPAAPTWIIAIAAVFLAAGAIVTSVLAIRALGRQSRQLRDQQMIHAKLAELLPLLADELRESLHQRKRAQAARVFIEVDRIPPAGAAALGQDEPDPRPWRLRAKVRNTSRQPIHDLHVIWQRGMVRMGKPDRAGRLMPGDAATFERLGPEATSDPVDPAILGALLAFRDAAGVRWAVREDGTLTDVVAPAQDPQAPAE